MSKTNDEYYQWIVDKIKDSYYQKFIGVTPEGFVLVREETLELLKEEKEWENFKQNPSWIDDKNRHFLSKEK